MRVLVSGGGSGGHIYPALAIAKGLRQSDPDCQLLYVGTSHGLEKDLVPRADIPFATIHARGLLVKGVSGKIVGAMVAMRGLFDALAVVRAFRPDVAVGTGGYVSGPVGLAATLQHVPLVIQEQNAWPGWTNRRLARRSVAVLVPYAEAVRYFPSGTRIIVAGNPVQRSSDRLSRHEARRRLGLKEEGRFLMATGGSQGAQAINQFLAGLMPQVLADESLGMIWATGKRYFSSVMAELRQTYPEGWDQERVKVVEYFYDIPLVYQASDLFVGRAGAMTLADCQAYGMPAVLVPSPHVTEDHQTKNAQVIQTRGAGILLAEDVLPGKASEVLALLRDGEGRRKMSERMLSLYDNDAIERIIQTIRDAARARG